MLFASRDSNSTMLEIMKHSIEVVSADEEARRDLKSLHESRYQLFKPGQMQDLKAEV